MRRRRVVAVAALLVVAAGVAAAAAYRYLVVKGYIRYNQWDRRVRGTLEPGAPAPDLTLARYEGGTVQLSSLWHGRPLFLVFGSCT